MEDVNLLMAETVKDQVLERLVGYTPVENAQQAVVLAYTYRMLVALKSFVQSNKIALDLESLERQVDAAISTSKFTIPNL